MIDIVRYETLNKGALVAKFDVKIQKWGGLIIRDCSLFDSNGKKWITFPSRQYEVEGKKKYFEYLAYENREIADKLKSAIMDAVSKKQQENKGEPELSDDMFF